MKDNQDNGPGLSLLDTLSCGLGGTVLLFVIFGSLQHRGDRASRAQDGLDKAGITVLATTPAASLNRTARLYTLEIDNLNAKTPVFARIKNPEEDGPVLIHESERDQHVRQLLWIPDEDIDQVYLLLEPVGSRVKVTIELKGASAGDSDNHRTATFAVQTDNPIVYSGESRQLALPR